MRFLSALSLLATTSVYVLAQDTPTSTTTAATTQSTTSCDAQNILDACIQSIQIQVENCGPNEWDCLCEQTNNLLTCYNNCPLDPGRIGVQQQKVSYCNAAGITSTTTTTRASTTSTTATSTTEAGATTTSEGAAAETSDADDAGVRLDVGLGFGGGVLLAVLGGLV